ncbi:MAG: protein kinase, partial [Aggregatilineales bacterium]
MATSQKNTAPAADPLIGTRLGDYEIRRLIGRGGMARVYEGYDSNLERRAAIKVITPQSEDSEEMKQRFFREARAVANLHHPNIVTVYQFGQGENLYYLAMRLLEGQTLLQKLK